MDKLLRPTDDCHLLEERENKMKRAIAQAHATEDEKRALQADESSRQSRENL